MILKRPFYEAAAKRALERNPICAVLGPRQCGKTTLARQIAGRRKEVHFFDLESFADRARLSNPELVLERLRGLIIIDEIQRMPELFTILRPLADRRRKLARFLILGSAAPELLRNASESLAGRIGFVDMSGFNLSETGERFLRRLWLRGGFPRSFLASSDQASLEWRLDFIRGFLETDIPRLGLRIPAEALRRFWMMTAHYHGQVWNAAELARSLGVNEKTTRHYLDLLSAAYVMRQLQPWHENIAKRQNKSPKIYIRDSGLFHALLSIERQSNLEAHPKFGASWEGFAMEQILARIGPRNAYYWGTHAGAELDLLFFHAGRRYGVEFKCADAPVMTKSLHVALSDLRLDQAWIVYPGKKSYPVHERVEVMPLSQWRAP